jgi:hypothetical protein
MRVYRLMDKTQNKWFISNQSGKRFSEKKKLLETNKFDWFHENFLGFVSQMETNPSMMRNYLLQVHFAKNNFHDLKK